jgi:hypothetical protein
MNKHEQAGKIITAVSGQIADQGTVDQGTKIAQLGLESNEEVIELASQTTDLQEALVDAEIIATVGAESQSVTAGLAAAAIAHNPNAVVNANLSGAETGAVVVSSSFDSVAVEAFDGQDIAAVAAVSAAYNFMAPTASTFLNAFAPIKVIGANEGGLSLKTPYSGVPQMVGRNGNGVSDAGIDKLIPMSKAMYMDGMFNTAKNRLYAFKNANTQDLLVADVPGSVDGKAVAPIKAGISANLITLGVSESDLNGDVSDRTYSLDRKVRLDKLYYSVENGDGSVTEIIPVSTKTISGLDAHLTITGSNKDFQLVATGKKILVDLGNVVAASGNSTILTDGTYNAEISFDATVSGNTATGDIKVSFNDVKVSRVMRKSDGVDIPAGEAVFTTVKNLFKNLQMVGYDVEAYLTNSNDAVRGTIVTSTIDNRFFPVPVRTEVTAIFPVGFEGNKDNDGQLVADQVNTTAVQMEAEFIDKALDFINEGSAKLAIDANAELGVPGELFLTPYLKSSELDLNGYKNLSSAEQDADIKGYIAARLKDHALKMIAGSRFMAHMKTAYTQGTELTVIIGTSPALAGWIDKGMIKLGDNIKVELVTSDSYKIEDTIVMSLKVEKSGEVHPTNSAFTGWRPTVNVDRTTSGKAVYKQFTVNPSYESYITSPVWVKLNVTGSEALGIAAPFKMETV